MTTALTLAAALVMFISMAYVIVRLIEQRDNAASNWADEVFANVTLKAKVRALEAEAEELHLLLTEAQLRAGDTVHVPLLRVIPGQRTGEHDDLPVADGVFPVHTEVDDTWLELLVTRPVDGPAS